MNIEFDDFALKELLENGKTADRRYKRLSQSIIKQYVKTVSFIRAANRLEDLFRIKSLHYEKKKGNLKDIEAVWINDQYRLLFQSLDEDTLLITKVLLIEISKHYGD